MKILGQILLIAAIVLTLIVAGRTLNRIEQFGMSPGTLVQLNSTHVPDTYNAGNYTLWPNSILKN